MILRGPDKGICLELVKKGEISSDSHGNDYQDDSGIILSYKDGYALGSWLMSSLHEWIQSNLARKFEFQGGRFEF